MSRATETAETSKKADPDFRSTVKEYRELYAGIRATCSYTPRTFNKFAARILTEEWNLPNPWDATPREWVKAARWVQVRALHRGPEWN